MKDGKVFANSRDVAEFFGKRHDHVLRDIRNMDLSSNLRASLFLPTILLDKYGRELDAFDMTRDGFTLLAMAFTGKKALQFKLQYIEAFNRMEAQLKTALPISTGDHGLLMELISQQTETNRLLRVLVEGNQSVTQAVNAVQNALPKPKDERMLSAREAQNTRRSSLRLHR